MATVEENETIAIMKYNNLTEIDIAIRTKYDDNEISLMDEDVRFLYRMLSKWIKEMDE